MPRPIAILDVDGTLVDTNYHHAVAWFRALRQYGQVVGLTEIHRCIGMGGDQVVIELAGQDFEDEHGDDVRAAEKALYMQMISEVEPLASAREFVQTLKDRGHVVVLASSADVEETKPAPDLVQAAIKKAGGGDAVMVGDSIWDCKAAANADVPTIGLLTGGFSEAELTEAGAANVFRTLPELLEHLDDTPLG